MTTAATRRRTMPAPEPVDASRAIAAARALCRWFRASARELPWRGEGRSPYAALVSEAMLQQTQVSRVLTRFAPFMARFPTVADLARAPEADVLAMWSGLGYYRRARLLHAAAKAILERHGGEVPGDVDTLHDLPGIGRYTAGAIASIVFGEPAPIADGNVTRVVLRLEGRPLAHGSKEALARAWEVAELLVTTAAGAGPEVSPGLVNEALMELGATICTPRSPRCGECPLSSLCAARRAGRQDSIPAPKAATRRRPHYCDCVIVRRGSGAGARVLVIQRPARGLWAGLWQPPTIDSGEAPATSASVRTMATALVGPCRVRRAYSFPFTTTHRDVTFTMWNVAHTTPVRTNGDMRWIGRDELDQIGLANPHRKILLAALDGEPGDQGS